MRRYVTRKTVLFRRLLIAAVIIALIAVYAADAKVNQYADMICKSSCSRLGEEMINEAVSTATKNYDLAKLVNVDDDGSFAVDSQSVNEITSMLISYINDRLSDEGVSYVDVPAGAFTGISFFSGRGPNVRIDIYSVGSPKAELSHGFVSSGINQTLFELYAVVEIDFNAVMPSKSVSVTVKRKVLLVQRVIVGDVPQLYYDKIS